MTMVPDCPVEKQFWSISGVGLVNTYARLYLRCSYNMGHLALTGTNDKHFRDHGFDTVPYCPLEKWSKCMTGKCFPEMKLETSIRNE